MLPPHLVRALSWLLPAALASSALLLGPLAAQDDAPAPDDAPAESAAETPTGETEPEDAPDPDAMPLSAADDTMGSARDELDAIAGTLNLSQERIAALRAEIEAISGDAAQLGAELIAAGQRVGLAEIEVGDVEERLRELFAREEIVRVRLDGQDRSIASLLAALQRISAHPPPAIIVDPVDALGSARAAIIMSAVLPQLQERAQIVVDDLNALSAIKAEAMTEAAQLNANLTTLHEEQLRIATIIEARKQGVEWLSEEILVEEAEAQALASRATSLEQLISTLEARIAAVTEASAATRAAQAGQPIPDLDEATIRMALANTERTEPAIPIASARGYLTAPAPGVNIVSFGASDGFGGISRGVSMVTRADAQIVAPADSWVVYHGPYLNYGQIIILNAGQGYSIVLAGLETIDVEMGQFVLMGEPLGAMGQRTLGRAVETSAGAARPTLYIELREGGVPINPSGWWPLQADTIQSG